MNIVSVLQDGVVTASDPVVPTFYYTSLNNPARTEVTDDFGNWLATFTNGSRTVTHRGPQRTFVEYAKGVHDTFDRSVLDGWGVTERSGVWYTTGGPNADFSVSSSMGHMSCNTLGIARRASVSNILQDIDATVMFRSDKTAVGDQQLAGIMFAYQGIDDHYLARIRFTPAVITDTFDRVTASGWGSANSGQSWSTSGGTSTDYSTTGTTGVHSLNTLNISRRTVLSSTSATNFDVAVRVKTSALASGASQVAAILGRYVDSNNHYIFRIRAASTSGHELFSSIQKTVAGTTTTISSEVTTPYVHSANSYFWIRAQANGTTLRMRTWPDGMTEPAAWDVTMTDSTFTGAGSVGMRSILLTGNTNTPPVLFTYDDFQATLDGVTADTVDVSLQVRVAGTYTTLGPTVALTGVGHSANEWFHLRVYHAANGSIKVRAWKDGTTEPSSWHIQLTDTTYTSGRVGLRSIINSSTTNAPVIFSYDNFDVSGSWPVNPTIQHNAWVRLLNTPFTGTVDETWLAAAVTNVTPDVLTVAMQYIGNALPVTDPAQSNLQVMGDSHYGPSLANGARQEGADFNDYLGVSWVYGSSSDAPEVDQFRCLDCSGFVRMVYGYRLGIPLQLSTLDGISLPRISADIADNGPGIEVVHSSSQMSDLTSIMPGDIVAFDADTSNPDEEEGQIDHVGIYIGVDVFGKPRFISSRKTANGPTFADVGGPSVIGIGSTLYSRSLRIVRRF